MRSSPAQILDRLIAFDTTSRNSNLALLDFVRDRLDGLGVSSAMVHDETGQKANLLATIGPDDRPGIVLSGHTDVVPVDGRLGQSDPSRRGSRRRRIHGRGACDMEGLPRPACWRRYRR